jgi:hypothetical protein
MPNLLGNKTEDEVNKFLDNLDNVVKIGPESLKGVAYDKTFTQLLVGCSSEEVDELFAMPKIFEFDEEDQVYLNFDVLVEEFDGNNNVIQKVVVKRYYIDNNVDVADYEELCEKIVEHLPEITFDTHFDGVKSKQSEAAALYKVMVVNNLCENDYVNEIKVLLENYDYINMRDSTGELGFMLLLKKIQEEAGRITKTVLMCSSQKLLKNSLKKRDTSFEMYLLPEHIEWLRRVSERSSELCITFNERFKSCKNPLEKATVGDQLEKQQQALLEEFADDEAKTLLFKIFNLNLNCVPERKTRQIRAQASTFVSELMDEGVIIEYDEILMFKKKLIKRAQRLYLSRMKVQRYKLWSEGKFKDLLPKY